MERLILSIIFRRDLPGEAKRLKRQEQLKFETGFPAHLLTRLRLVDETGKSLLNDFVRRPAKGGGVVLTVGDAHLREKPASERRTYIVKVTLAERLPKTLLVRLHFDHLRENILIDL